MMDYDIWVRYFTKIDSQYLGMRVKTNILNTALRMGCDKGLYQGLGTMIRIPNSSLGVALPSAFIYRQPWSPCFLPAPLRLPRIVGLLCRSRDSRGPIVLGFKLYVLPEGWQVLAFGFSMGLLMVEASCTFCKTHKL